MSKLVITAQASTIKAAFDKRFGRASWFCIYHESDAFAEFIENPFKDEHEGAGIQVVEKLAALGVNKVVSGDFGPKVEELLKNLSIQMIVMREENLTVEKILSKIK